jgi:hypothetical protein
VLKRAAGTTIYEALREHEAPDTDLKRKLGGAQP